VSHETCRDAVETYADRCRVDPDLERLAFCMMRLSIGRISLKTWRISEHPNADLVNGMLDDVIANIGAKSEPIIHTDRGCHYRWPGWIERMKRNGKGNREATRLRRAGGFPQRHEEPQSLLQIHFDRKINGTSPSSWGAERLLLVILFPGNACGASS